MSGLELVKQTFANGKKCFMPYFPVGYPDLPTSIDILEGLAKAGADALEVGVPFSDPLADGPTVQAATQKALANGTRLPDCIEALRELRTRGVTIPLMLMGYVNPFLAYGLPDFIRDAVDAGASGFIVPDLPPDEGGEFQQLVVEHDAALAYLLAPTSNAERIQLVADNARGFIYLVSVTGITGQREAMEDVIQAFVQRVRKVAKQPLAVGFGIRTAEKAKAVGDLADGVIIGSQFIKLAEESPAAALEFARDVRSALG